MEKEYQIIIIGAGPSGLGFALALKDFGIEHVLILEQDTIGSSFLKWPQQTRFITPSFTSNGFGMPDLNAISLHTSPAYTLSKEHLSGVEYAEYLKRVAKEYHLPVQTQTKVLKITKQHQGFRLECEKNAYLARYLVMAVGEAQFPKTSAFVAGRHYSTIASWDELEGDTFTVVGGKESAMDAAINLLKKNRKVNVLTRSSVLNQTSADPSIRLSPYTRERLSNILDKNEIKNHLNIFENISIQSIIKGKNEYVLMTSEGEQIVSATEPIICTGFENGVSILGKDLFKFDATGVAKLNDVDESTLVKNVFMVGPSVRHGSAIFCYIYKFRQRFAVVAESIAIREGINVEPQLIEAYQRASFYLDDCEQCEVSCEC